MALWYAVGKVVFGIAADTYPARVVMLFPLVAAGYDRSIHPASQSILDSIRFDSNRWSVSQSVESDVASQGSRCLADDGARGVQSGECGVRHVALSGGALDPVGHQRLLPGQRLGPYIEKYAAAVVRGGPASGGCWF